jgi:DNA-binding SARP family transcriptional activator/tetratricopeptide (TPR) repeat protein
MELVVAGPEAGLRFGLLGPLQVVDGADAVRVVSAAKQRIVLAALLLGGGAVVSASGLAEALWDASPPPNAATVMRTYVARLRHALGPAGARIVGRPSGWAVELRCAEELDVAEVDWLSRAAREAAGAGEWLRASSLLDRALSMWRGEPLADVPSAALARREVERFGELRIQLTETRIDADLRLGRHGDLVPELRRLAAEHPMREHIRAQLMLACYRCGHQAAALEVYRDARSTLAGELGVEPGHELHDLHQRILTADPDLAVGAAVIRQGAAGGLSGSSSSQVAGETAELKMPARWMNGPDAVPRMPAGGEVEPPPVPAVMPRQLPGQVRHFVGRAGELERLSALAEEAADSGAAVVISAIGGMAGVGKTALAVHWAHQVAHRYTDGQLYVNLRGFDPSGQPLPAAEPIVGFLQALGVHPGQIPAELDARAGLYRSLLAGKRMLILLDNARDAAQVRPLLPGSPGCLVIVTSRSQLAGLAAADGAQMLTLDLLSDDDAAGLFAARVGQRRAAAEPAAVAGLTRLCARLPLALTIAAARAAARPAYPLTALAAELGEAGERLDALDAGEPAASVRAVFSWSYQNLSPLAARLFRLLGVYPGPDISAAAAASLMGLPPPQARSALQELTATSLLNEHSPGRYLFHDLLRCYATELASSAEGDNEERQAISRILDHYLHTATELVAGSWRALELAAPQPGVTPEAVGCDEDLAWFDAEHNNLLRLTGQAAASGFDAHAWKLAWTMTDFLDRRGYWDDWADAQQTALAAAYRLGDRAGQARAHNSLGQASIQLRRYHDGHAHLRRALHLYTLLEDREGQAHVHLCRCVASDWQQHYPEALASARQALDLLGPNGSPDLKATALNNVGYCHALIGDYHEALIWCQQARDLWQELGVRFGEADAWDSIAYAHQRLGHYSQAIDCYKRAQRLHSGNRYRYARHTGRLGDAYQETGNTAAAKDAWQQALAILDELHHADAAQVRAKLNSLPPLRGSQSKQAGSTGHEVQVTDG